MWAAPSFVYRSAIEAARTDSFWEGQERSTLGQVPLVLLGTRKERPALAQPHSSAGTGQAREFSAPPSRKVHYP